MSAGGRSWVGWQWASAGGRQGGRLCRAGWWKDQLLEERGGRAGWGAGILPDATRAGSGGGAAGRTAAALEKGRPQAKSRGLGAEDLEPSRAWKDQAQRIQWLKGWILRFGLWREGRAQEQELLLEGNKPARVRGPHGALVRGVLGLKSGGGGWVVVLRKENCRVRGEASGPGLEGWSWGPRGLHPRSQCSQRPRQAQF